MTTTTTVPSTPRRTMRRWVPFLAAVLVSAALLAPRVLDSKDGAGTSGPTADAQLSDRSSAIDLPESGADTRLALAKAAARDLRTPASVESGADTRLALAKAAARDLRTPPSVESGTDTRLALAKAAARDLRTPASVESE